MNIQLLEREFKEKVSDQVRIVPEGLDRYIVLQPFMFDDGDHFVVILRKTEHGWVLTDEGHTLMHVQYDELNLQSPTRSKIIESTLSAFSMERIDGELKLSVPDERFGDALFSYLQGLNKISDIEFLRVERARSAFLEDVRALMEEMIPEDRRQFDYHDPRHDPDRNYVIDCRINGITRPNFVFFVQSNEKCLHATIVCQLYENRGIEFRATGIFEDQTDINRRAVAQFSDVAYKQFSSLGSANRMKEYFEEVLRGQA